VEEPVGGDAGRVAQLAGDDHPLELGAVGGADPQAELGGLEPLERRGELRARKTSTAWEQKPYAW
jgi:hypothetical protein